jgi:adenine-specific DNA-methyltransferase
MAKKISTESSDIIKEKIQILKQIIPECFSEGILDIEKLRKTIGETLDSNDEKYILNWAGRNNSFKNIQTTSKGTIIANKKDSVNFEETENIFIEGENLEVLKLLQKSYFEKIKLIYIDPPYNTGNDFIYQDNFRNNTKSYLEQTEQMKGGIKLISNPETSGRFHSDWISFIYPRLFLARNLLSDDGVLVVSIDDNESHNLRIVLNEIFGEENFCADVSWQKRYTRSNNTVDFTTVVEHLFFYSKSDKFTVNLLERTKEADSRYTNPDKDPRGPWKGASFLGPVTPQQRPNLGYAIINPNTHEETYPTTNAWRRSLEEFNRLQKENLLYWGLDGKNSVPSIKMFLSDARNITPINFWDHEYAGNTDDGTKELGELIGKNIFNNPKPTQLIKRIIEHTCGKNDLILDFFAGSGTTTHAVMELNKLDDGKRRCISIQIPELCDEKSNAYKSGYKTIADIGKDRIKKVIEKIKKESKQLKLKNNTMPDLGFKVFKLTKSNFKIWEDVKEKDQNKLKEQMKLFESPLISGYKDDDVIYECIIKEGFDLNCKIEKLNMKSNDVYKISDDDRIFYLILDKSIKSKTIEELKLTKEKTLVCIDASLDDSQKTNLSKQCNLKTL